MRKALINAETGKVTNIIEINENANWTPPDGCYLVDAEKEGSAGDSWIGFKFIKPILPILPEPPPVRDLAAEIDELRVRIEKLEKDNVLAG